MCAEFVGSRPRSEGFSPGSPVFLPPQKPTFPNSIWNQWTQSPSVEMPLQNSNLFIIINNNNNNNNNNIYYLILRKFTYIHDQMRITNITKKKLYVSVIKIN